MTSRRVSLFLIVCGLVLALAPSMPARQTSPVSPSLFSEMRWRAIGPFRGGRTKAVAGVPSQPFTFYIGVCNGGVWKTTDAGRTWQPIFDDQPTGSIGWVEVAPSDPNIVYVGSGEGLQRPDLSTGDGIYKSTDAGKTWTHLGLRDGQQIPKIAVDPRNPNRLFVAVLGHPYGPNEERGIFRSTDGGQTFQKVLFKDENTGGKDVDIDPSNPDIVYATLWETAAGTVGERRVGRHQWRHLQVDRWRHHVEATEAGPARRTDGGRTRHCAQPPVPSLRDGERRQRRDLPIRRRRRILEPRDNRRAPGWTDRRGRASRQPEGPGHGHRHQRGQLEVHRRRQDLGPVQGRAWRRRLPEPVVQPGQPGHHPARGGPGRRRHAQRRPDVELLVQPAHRAALPRHDRQRVSVPRLRRPAGKRLGLRGEPRQRRADHVPRVAPGRRRGVRLRSARSAAIPTSSTAAR